MKKVLAIILCMTMILSFGACSSNKEKDKTQGDVEEKVLTIKEAIESVNGLKMKLDDNKLTYTPRFETMEDDYASIEVFYDDGETFEKIDELHNKLGFSGALIKKMENTRGMDGQKIEENENYRITWSFANPYLCIIYEMK